MAKSPQFPCYARDLVADTVHLTTEQFGAYWRLLCAAWNGIDGCEQCYLPADDDDTLARIAGLAPDRWKQISGKVKKLFGREGDKYFSKRMLTELAKQKDRSEKARNAVEKRLFRPIGRLDCGLAQDQSQDNPRAPAPVANANSSLLSASRDQEETPLLAYLDAVLSLHPKPGLEYNLSRALQEMQVTLPSLPEFVAALKAWRDSEDWTREGGRFVTHGPNWVRGGGWKTKPSKASPRSLRQAGSDSERMAAYANVGDVIQTEDLK